jgi:hypothetical protein
MYYQIMEEQRYYIADNPHLPRQRLLTSSESLDKVKDFFIYLLHDDAIL